jgi:hypothetical protein
MNDFNEFLNAEREIGEAELKNLEELAGYQLPADFKEHYLIFNGGKPEHYLYVFGGDPVPLVVQEFLPIAYGDAGNTVEGNYKELVIGERVIPKNLLPFGSDPGGDFYCLDMDNGKIVVFRAEYLPALSECITEVAGSMTEFLNGLVEEV